MTIYILTYSPNAAQIYGNLLALRTARTGFPTAEIIVTDNNSCHEAREIFMELSATNGYEYRQLNEQIQHSEYIQNTIDNASGPIAFVDGDVVFWKSCEHFWDDISIYEIRIKGVLYPSHTMSCPSLYPSHKLYWFHPRLHTSFLCLSDAQEVNFLLEPLKAKYGNPWTAKYGIQMLVARNGWDTGSFVYRDLERFHKPFIESELDSFDHLRVGTHPNAAEIHVNAATVQAKGNTGADPLLERVHRIALSGDYEHLRGVWRDQQREFLENHNKGPYWTWPDFWKR